MTETEIEATLRALAPPVQQSDEGRESARRNLEAATRAPGAAWWRRSRVALALAVLAAIPLGAAAAAEMGADIPVFQSKTTTPTVYSETPVDEEWARHLVDFAEDHGLLNKGPATVTSGDLRYCERALKDPDRARYDCAEMLATVENGDVQVVDGPGRITYEVDCARVTPGPQEICDRGSR